MGAQFRSDSAETIYERVYGVAARPPSIIGVGRRTEGVGRDEQVPELARPGTTCSTGLIERLRERHAGER